MTTRYMLDTNIVSHLVRGNAAVDRHIVGVPMAALCISAITEGELLFGLARRPEATRLHTTVHELLLRLETLPWTKAVAGRYGQLRAELAREGKALGTLDMLIAAHAVEQDAVLVTNDGAFAQIEALRLEDWLQEVGS